MAEKEQEKESGKSAQSQQVQESGRGYIQYIGLATARGVKREEWEAAGVNDQGDVWWVRTNGYRVDRAALSDDAYNIGIRPDRLLVLIGGDPAEGGIESHPLAEEPPAEQMPVMPDPILYRK